MFLAARHDAMQHRVAPQEERLVAQKRRLVETVRCSR